MCIYDVYICMYYISYIVGGKDGCNEVYMSIYMYVLIYMLWGGKDLAQGILCLGAL